MKTLHLLGIAAVIFSAANTSHAGFYAKATGLYTSSSDISIDNAKSFKASLGSNTGIAAALGYKFSMLRAEVELQSMKSGSSGGANTSGSALSTGSFKQFNGFVNGFVDLPSFFGLAPYVGAGVGRAEVNLANFNVLQGASNVLHISDKKDVFGYQLMAGLEFHLMGQATLHAGYRIINRQNMDMRDVISSAQQSVKFGDSHIFELGVALGF